MVLSEKVALSKTDEDFTARNAWQSVTVEQGATNGKVLLFGGKDSEDDREFNQVYLLDLADGKTLKRIHFQEGKVIPPKRNSHTFVRAVGEDQRAFLACGANSDGPLKDIYEVDLKSFEFTKLVLDESEMLLSATEMHTCHVYNNNTELLLVGGRALPSNETDHEKI